VVSRPTESSITPESERPAVVLLRESDLSKLNIINHVYLTELSEYVYEKRKKTAISPEMFCTFEIKMVYCL